MNLEINAVCTTNGRGLYSTTSRKVEIEEINVYELKHDHSGYVQVFFNEKSWSVSKHGLICSDPRFLQEFRKALVKEGFTVSQSRSIDYADKENQGKDFVMMLAKSSFIKALCSRSIG